MSDTLTSHLQSEVLATDERAKARQIHLDMITFGEILAYANSLNIPKRTVSFKAGITPPYMSQLTRESPEMRMFLFDRNAKSLKTPSVEIVRKIIKALKELLDENATWRSSGPEELRLKLDALAGKYQIFDYDPEGKRLMTPSERKLVDLLENKTSAAQSPITVVGPFASGKSRLLKFAVDAHRAAQKTALQIHVGMEGDSDDFLVNFNFDETAGGERDSFVANLSHLIDRTPGRPLVVIDDLNAASQRIYDAVRDLMEDKSGKAQFLLSNSFSFSTHDIDHLLRAVDRTPDWQGSATSGSDIIVETGWHSRTELEMVAREKGVDRPKDIQFLWNFTAGQPYLVERTLWWSELYRKGKQTLEESAPVDPNWFEQYPKLISAILQNPKTRDNEKVLRAYGVHPDQAGYPKGRVSETPELHKRWFSHLV